MTWLDDAKQKYEQAMEQFKGKRSHCFLCGAEGEYDKDLVPDYVRMGEKGVRQGGTDITQVEAYFRCKDHDACKQRQESKGD